MSATQGACGGGGQIINKGNNKIAFLLLPLTFAYGVEFNISNSIDNGLLPILVPEQDSTDDPEVKWNYKHKNKFYGAARKNDGMGGSNLTIDNNGESNQLMGMLEKTYQNDKSWCLHVTSLSSQTFTYLTKTSANGQNKTLSSLYNIINVGAAKKALANKNTQEEYNGIKINKRGHNVTATFSDNNYLVMSGEDTTNGSIIVQSQM